MRVRRMPSAPVGVTVRTAYGRGRSGASGAELALDLRVEHLLALGVETLEDGRDVLALDDLVEPLADAGAATGQQHAGVVLRPRLGQLLDGRLRVRVLLEERLLLRQVHGRLPHRHVTGRLRERHGVLRVGEELDELQRVLLAVVRDRRRDADARTTGGTVAVTGQEG